MKKRLLIIGIVICLLLCGCSSSSRSRYDDDDEEWFGDSALNKDSQSKKDNDKDKGKDKNSDSVFGDKTGSSSKDDSGTQTGGANVVPATGSISVTSGDLVVTGDPVRDRYYRSQLSDEEQLVYDEIYVIISNMLGETDVSSLDADVIAKAAQAVTYDFPEFFYYSSYSFMQYTLNGQLQKISFIADYTMSESERDYYRQSVDEYVNQFKSTIPPGAGDYEIAKLLLEYIAINTDYILNAPHNQDMISVVCYGQSVCSGYAKTYQHVMNELGYDTIFVFGSSKKTGEAHAWLKIKLDGEYYNIDNTWADTTIPGFDDSYVNPATVCYDYFCVPDSWNDMAHTTEYFLPLPECNSTKDNFYVKNGLYVDSKDPAAIQNAVNSCHNLGYDIITFKCSDAMVYSYWKNYLFDQSHVFDFVGPGSISYSFDEYSYAIIMG